MTGWKPVFRFRRKIIALPQLEFTKSQLIPTMRLFSKRFNDFGKTK